MTKKLKLKYKKEPALSINDLYSRLYPEESDRYYKQIVFQITEDCCMACTYCYQHGKTNHKMDFSTAKQFVDNLLNDKYPEVCLANTFGVCFEFIGGEPLMEVGLIKQVWEYFFQKALEMRHPWLTHARFSLCSNGLLYFNKEFQDFIQRWYPWCSMSFSIDGNKKLHDTCRIDLAGNGTYDRAVAAMQSYSKLTGSIPSTKMTLSPENVAFTYEAIINLIDLGYTDIHLNCIFEKGWELAHARILYQQLRKLADYLIDNELNDKIYISIFEEDSFKPMKETDNDNWCGGIISDKAGFAVDWKGKLYPCLRYMGSSLNGKQKPLSLGTVENGFYQTVEEKDNSNLLSDITRRSQSTDKCFYCPIAKGCAWCSGYNYEISGTPNYRATYICVMHQARALANCYYWNKIYKKTGINKCFVNHVPESWALGIIDKKESEELNNG